MCSDANRVPGLDAARNLLPYLTAAENVALPMRLAGRRRRVRKHSRELLDLVGSATAQTGGRTR